MNWRKQCLASSSTASTTGHDGRTDRKINLDRRNEKRSATSFSRSKRELTKSGSWGLYRGRSGSSKREKNGQRWICGSATFFPFGSVSVTKTSHLHCLYTLPPSLFLSLLIPLFCSIHFALSSLATLLMRVSSVFMTIIVRC